MHAWINGLVLGTGTGSGVHRAVRGMARAVAETAGQLDRLSIAVRREAAPGALPYPPGAHPAHVALPAMPWRTRFRMLRILYELGSLTARARAAGADLIHWPAYVGPIRALGRGPSRGGASGGGGPRTVVTVHDAFALRAPGLCTRLNRLHYRWRVPRTLAVADGVIVPTAHVRGELLAWNQGRERPLADLGARIHVIPWGIDGRFLDCIAAPPAPARVEEAKERLGLPAQYLLYVGRVEPKKNVVKVIEAFFAATAAAGLPHGLVLAGPPGWGQARSTVASRIEGLRLRERVVEAGYLDDADLPLVYAGADGLCFPSLAEGFGLPVLEAMACGTPVVCADIPPLREIGGEAPLYAGPTDLPALREALEAVLADTDAARALRHARIEAGRAHAAAFTWRRHGQATWDLYRGLHQRARREPAS